jgi:hypothetical protein
MALPELIINPATPGTAAALTTLGAAVSSTTATTISTAAPATTAYQAPGQFRILIDSEIMLVTAGANTTSWTVTRGVEGSTAAAHSSGVSIYHVITAGSLDARYQLFGEHVWDTPEAHGAQGDGLLLSDVTVVNSTKVLTSAGQAHFTSADVGKTIAIDRKSSGTFTTTIASITDATHLVLTAGPGADIATATECVYGTDDTAAFVAAMANVVAQGIALGNYSGRLVLGTNIYMIAGAQTKGGATLGNAQIPIPPISSAGQKFLLDIFAPSYGAGHPHFSNQQTVAQVAGCTLFSTSTVGNDATHGYPSVVGGPTTADLGSTDAGFSNMIVRTSGVGIMQPYNPVPLGWDFNCVAGVNLLDIAAQSFASPVTLSGSSAGFTAGGIGLRLPLINNNDTVEVGAYTCYGYNYALAFADHTNVKKLMSIFCNIGCYCNATSTGAQKHGATFMQISHEGSGNLFDFSSGGAAKTFPLMVFSAHMEVSNAGSVEITDSTNSATGVGWMSNTSRAIAKTGATNFTINSLF